MAQAGKPGGPPGGRSPASALKATAVLADLNQPIPRHKNAIWCAGFLAAWKALQDMSGEPLSFQKTSKLANALNTATPPQTYVPDGTLYATAGWVQNGILSVIEKELWGRFPNKPTPEFPDITHDSFVAYSYLEASARFAIPYSQRQWPFTFTDSARNPTRVTSFGILAENGVPSAKLRAQLRVLSLTGVPESGECEFSIDLCANSPSNQIVVARIPRQSTLAAALMRATTTGRPYSEHPEGIGSSDSLTVPDIRVLASHHFSELEGKVFDNPKLKGRRLDVAQEDIMFRLDKSGAELKAESKIYESGIGHRFSFDRPFLVWMQKRGATEPFFVAWIDNAELLCPWAEDREPRSN